MSNKLQIYYIYIVNKVQIHDTYMNFDELIIYLIYMHYKLVMYLLYIYKYNK